MGEPPYPAAVKAAATAGTLKPNDYTSLNHSFALAAGGAISTANDCATWIQALVSGHVFDAEYQQLWLDSLRPEDPRSLTVKNTGMASYEYAGERTPYTITAARRRVTIRSLATTPPIRSR